jgi:hypothetical protein
MACPHENGGGRLTKLLTMTKKKTIKNKRRGK